MGQYFTLVSIDSKERLEPLNLGSGMKEMEIASTNVPALLQYLLADSRGGGGSFRVPSDADYHGRWAGDRIVVAGDYSEAEIGLDPDDEYHTLYAKAEEEFTDISTPAREEYNRAAELSTLQIRDHPWEDGERFDVVGIHPDDPATLARNVSWDDALATAQDYTHGPGNVSIRPTTRDT